MRDIQLNFCCIVESNPAGAALQLTPAFIRACTLLCFYNGENAFAGELSCCGIVCAGAFADCLKH